MDISEATCDPSPYLEPASTEKDLYQQLKAQKLKSIPVVEIEYVNSHSLYKANHTLCLHRITSRLGSGQFGCVRKGTWTSQDRNKARDVAVKTLGRPHARSETSRIKLLQEAAIMGQFFHPNVIKLLGVAISDDLVQGIYI